MKNSQITYKETKVFNLPNAIVRVHFPDITEEENNERMKLFKKAAEDFLRALYASK